MAKKPESAAANSPVEGPAVAGLVDGLVDNIADAEILCGFHGVRAALTRAPGEVIEVLMDAGRHDPRMKRLRHELAAAGISFRSTPRDELERLSRGVRHQGVIARVRSKTSPDQPELYRLLADIDRRGDPPALLLILDQVQDPHNLGACLRTADGAGVDAVILPKDGACPVNPTVTRVAAGAVGRVPVFYVPNLARTLMNLQKRGVWITGGDEAAERTVYEMDFNAATAIVMGAEGRGLRRLTREHCDQLARIPMSGSVSSLNVSVATGLFLFEALRQRAG